MNYFIYNNYKITLFDKKNNLSASSGDNLFLLSVIILPALENILSDGTEVAEPVKNHRAAVFKYVKLESFQYASVSNVYRLKPSLR